MDIRIDNLDDFKAALQDKLASDLQQVSDATLSQAEKIRAEASRNCPVDTGALAASGEVSITPEGVAITFGQGLRYGGLVHTRRPFLLQAVDSESPGLVDEISGRLST